MRVREMLEREIPEVATVSAEAYSGKEIIAFLFPETKDQGNHIWFTNTLQLWHADPDAKVVVVELEKSDVGDEDEALVGKIIAMALWEYHAAERSVGEEEEALFLATLEDTGVSMDALQTFGMFEEELESRNYAGKDHWHLTRLCTLPEWQKRGAAGMLVRWGTDDAEKKGIFCAVEGTDESLSLYEKLGWVKAEQIKIEHITAHILQYNWPQ